MSLQFDEKEARKADNNNPSIRTAGKFVGTITRAEKLLSKQNTEGVGISFKTDDGQTANYLDLYTVNSKGEKLPSLATVQAILCCTRTREAVEGEIKFEKWDNEAKVTYQASAKGYPALIGKRIGFLFQQELSDNPKDPSKHNDRVVIYGVFEPESELTASEILDKATKPEKLGKMISALMNKPINDRRTNGHGATSQPQSHYDDFDDSPPF